MPGILDFVRMEQGETYRETERGDGAFQPFYVNYQQVQPIRNAFYRVHASPDYEMILPQEKTYRCLLDDQPVKVRKGEFLLIHAYQRHQDLLSTESPYHTFHFLMRGDSAAPLENLFAEGLPPQLQVEKIPDPELLEVLPRRNPFHPAEEMRVAGDRKVGARRQIRNGDLLRKMFVYK